jgi:hypothetical protein
LCDPQQPFRGSQHPTPPHQSRAPLSMVDRSTFCKQTPSTAISR